ncbi:MAG: formylmethanofuran dehydrogenase subunit C [Pirellulales bacterium]
MPLVLTPKITTTVPIEVEGVTPSAVRGKTLDDVRRLETFHGNRRMPLGELFDVSGSGDDEQIVFVGDCHGVHWIGAGMTGGEITVRGAAGRHVGSEMTGGRIVVEGNAGDWVGGEMHGGVIHVHGRRSPHRCCLPRRARGMTGGTIIVDGDVGNEIGTVMRRGLIAVGGRCGDTPGFGMLAGTILVCGESGVRPGAGMSAARSLVGPSPPRCCRPFAAVCRRRPCSCACSTVNSRCSDSTPPLHRPAPIGPTSCTRCTTATCSSPVAARFSFLPPSKATS